MTKEEIKVDAEQVLSMTLTEIKALPNMLGKVAYTFAKKNGYYACKFLGKRTFFEVK